MELDKQQDRNNEQYYRSDKGRARLKNDIFEDKVIKIITDNAKIKNRKIKYKKESEANLAVQ